MKKLLLALPLLFAIGCSAEEDVSSDTTAPTKTYTQEQIDDGNAPSMIKMDDAIQPEGSAMSDD